MVTGEIKSKVDKIWDDIAAGGITNPITVIEQLTYLMFIRSLDEKELETEEFENMSGGKMDKIFPQTSTGQAMRWSRFKDRHPGEIFDLISQRVFPAVKNMKNGHLPDFNERGEMIEPEIGDGEQETTTAFARYMKDAMFLIPTPQVLEKIITGLEDLYEKDISDLDMQGDLYEYMLGKLSTAGRNGQFRTPRHIIKMMVELIQPTPDDLICDPACGTAGYLVAAAEYIRAHYEDTMTDSQWDSFAGEMFTGFDTDSTMLRISAMNLMLHSITNPDISYKDSVSKQNEISSKFTVCLAIMTSEGTQLDPAYDFVDYRKKVNRYVEEHKDSLAIYKLKKNIRLELGDYQELERVLTEELGSKEDYEREFGDTPFGLLIRKIAKLDHDAAMAAFSQFINDASLNQKQIAFVHKIINHVEQNGYMENITDLQKPPFDKPVSFIKLFDVKTRTALMQTIQSIRENAVMIA